MLQGQPDEFRIEKVTNQTDRALKLIRHLLDTVFGQLSFCHLSKIRNRVDTYYHFYHTIYCHTTCNISPLTLNSPHPPITSVPQ